MGKNDKSVKIKDTYSDKFLDKSSEKSSKKCRDKALDKSPKTCWSESSEKSLKKYNRRSLKQCLKKSSITFSDESKKPLSKIAYEKILKKIELASKFVGISIETAEFEWKPQSICVSLTVIYSFISCLYSAYEMIVSKNSFKIIELICVQGLLVPAIAKFIVSIKRQSCYYALTQSILKIATSNPHGKRATILIKFSKKSIRLVCICIACVATCVVIYSIYPIYAFVIEGQYVVLFPFYVPMVDRNKLSGYLANIVQELWFSILGTYGSLLYDCAFAFLISNISPMVALIKDDFDTLDQMAENPNIADSERTAYLKKILNEFYDLNGYFQSINREFGHIVLIQFAFGCMGIVLALFSIVANNWIGGIGYVAFLYTELSLLCYLGTMLDIAKEDLCDIIYGSKWYLYSIHDQKLILTMLTLVQSGATLWIGSLAPLNVSTLKLITEKIYSYFTMLMNFLG